MLFKKYLCITHGKDKKIYKNNNREIIAPTWNDEFKLPDSYYSVSDIQDYIEYVIKKHEKLTAMPPIPFYSNRINKEISV